MLNLRVVQLIPRWTTDTFRLQTTILTHVQCFNDNLPRDAILKLSFVMERYGVLPSAKCTRHFSTSTYRSPYYHVQMVRYLVSVELVISCRK